MLFRSHGVHGERRRPGRPGGAGGLFRIQRRRGRHDAPHRPRPDEREHPHQYDLTRPVPDAAPAQPAGACAAGAGGLRALSEAARPAGGVRCAGAASDRERVFQRRVSAAGWGDPIAAALERDPTIQSKIIPL